MKLVWSLALLVSIAYLAVCLLVYLMQAQVIFFPNMPGRQLEATPRAINLDYEDVYARTGDGETIHGWFIPATDAKLSLLFCHGNAGNISHRLESIALFNALGINVLIFDYRGYGQSTGTVSELGFYRDAEAIWRELTVQRAIPAESILIFGRSLGAAVASQLSAKVRPGAVILESAFASVPDMAAKLYPFLPVHLLSRFQFNNIEHVKRIQSPLLVIHSEADEIIPFAQGQAVYASADEPKRFMRIQGSHNGGFLSSGHVYTGGLEAFLRQFFPVRGPWPPLLPDKG